MSKSDSRFFVIIIIKETVGKNNLFQNFTKISLIYKISSKSPSDREQFLGKIYKCLQKRLDTHFI